jgi:hypothetical protein
MGDNSISLSVLNRTTGEIVRDLEPGDRIVSGKSVEAKARKKPAVDNSTIVEWNLENFTKMYVPEMRLWMKDLNQTEKAFLFSVGTYVSFDDCHLQYDNGRDIGSEDLVEITGLSRSIVYETIRSLVKKDIMYKGKNSTNRQYFVNPWIFCKGNRINKVLRTMFKNYRIRIMGGKQWKDLK